jgi:hypothetical protein
MNKLTPILLALLSASCATNDNYYITQREQIAAWERVEIARAQADSRKYEALSVAANNGSDVARVAVALAVGGVGNGQNFQHTQIPQVQAPQDEAYKWAALILPTATNIAVAGFGYKLGVTQSDNSRLQTEASYRAVSSGYTSNAQIASYIQAPGATTTTTTTNTSSTSNSLSGTGVVGSGSYAVRNCNGGIGGSATNGGPAGYAPGGNC